MSPLSTVYSVQSGAWAAASAGAGDSPTAPPTDPYLFKPPGWPLYNGYTTVNVTASSARLSTTDNTGLGQSQTTDYLIDGSVERGSLRIRGARNVHIRRGSFNVTAATVSDGSPPRAIELQYITGTCVIEGCLLQHEALNPATQGDAIYISNSPNATVIILGCRVPMIYGQQNRTATTPNGDHGDLFQSLGNGTTNGVGKLYVDVLTAMTAYQGFGIFDAGVNEVDLHRVDLGYSNSANAANSNAPSDGGGLFQFHGSSGTPSIYAADRVYVRETRSGSLGGTFVPNSTAWSAMNGSVPATNATITPPELTSGHFTYNAGIAEWEPGLAGTTYPIQTVSPGTHRGYTP